MSGSHSYAVVLSIMGADVQSHGATGGPSPCRLRSPRTFFMDELWMGIRLGGRFVRRVVAAESTSHSSAGSVSDLSSVSDCEWRSSG